MRFPRLRQMLQRGETIIAPGAYDPIGAKVVEALGFPAVYVAGFMTAAHLGIPEPDLTLEPLLDLARRVAGAVTLPVICDAGAGYGGPRQVARCVERFEDASVAAVHIEDAVYPRPATSTNGAQRVVRLDAFLDRLRAAMDARRHRDFLVIGRTDAFDARLGRGETERRGLAMRNAGVDVVVAKGVLAREDLAWFRRAVPNVPMMAWAGKEEMSVAEYAALGYQIVAYALAPITTAVGSLWDNYKTLKETGRPAIEPDRMLQQRQLVFDLIGMHEPARAKPAFPAGQGEGLSEHGRKRSMYKTILVSQKGKIAAITLNRPEVLNTINQAMRDELVAALDALDEDDGVSVVILKGAGRAFSAGNDVRDLDRVGTGRELSPGDTADDLRRIQHKQRVHWRIWDLHKPVIAQVHGYCFGTATLLITACDLLVVAEDAKLGNAKITMGAGVIADRYAWALGLRRAKWLEFLPGWRITGKEAVEWGWANLAVPASQLDEEVMALAEQIAVAPLTHLMYKKAAMNSVWERLGFRASETAAMNYHTLALKSKAGLEMQDRVGASGFIQVGAEMHSKYPKRHKHD